MIITQPRNGQVLKELMESAFSWKRPAAIRYPNLMTEEANAPLQEREPGKGEILVEGRDLLIIALGHMNTIALKTIDLLAKEGVKATLLDPVFIKPLDTDLICRLLLTHQKIVTIEEHSVIAGMGAIINHFLMQHEFNNIQVLNLGIPETFIEHGSHQELLDEIGLTPEKIAKKILTHFRNCLQTTYESIRIVYSLIFLPFLAPFYFLFSAISLKIVFKKKIKICSKMPKNLNK
jgi:1-deoxy-D-xylulose-5-phosphate synthase